MYKFLWVLIFSGMCSPVQNNEKTAVVDKTYLSNMNTEIVTGNWFLKHTNLKAQQTTSYKIS